MRKLGVLNTINHLTILAVTMILKAITTVIALVDTMESITVNKIPQDAGDCVGLANEEQGREETDNKYP